MWCSSSCPAYRARALSHCRCPSFAVVRLPTHAGHAFGAAARIVPTKRNLDCQDAAKPCRGAGEWLQSYRPDLHSVVCIPAAGRQFNRIDVVVHQYDIESGFIRIPYGHCGPGRGAGVTAYSIEFQRIRPGRETRVYRTLAARWVPAPAAEVAFEQGDDCVHFCCKATI